MRTTNQNNTVKYSAATSHRSNLRQPAWHNKESEIISSAHLAAWLPFQCFPGSVGPFFHYFESLRDTRSTLLWPFWSLFLFLRNCYRLCESNSFNYLSISLLSFYIISKINRMFLVCLGNSGCIPPKSSQTLDFDLRASNMQRLQKILPSLMFPSVSQWTDLWKDIFWP